MADEVKHGVVEGFPSIWDLNGYLDAVDGKEVKVTVGQSKADFDRAVRESIDRTHRRQVIAGS